MIELRGEKSVLKFDLHYELNYPVEVIMHNLISHNQLAGWKQSVARLDQTLKHVMEESDLLNDYYNCLIECDDDQATCKRVCRRILQ